MNVPEITIHFNNLYGGERRFLSLQKKYQTTTIYYNMRNLVLLNELISNFYFSSQFGRVFSIKVADSEALRPKVKISITWLQEAI